MIIEIRDKYDDMVRWSTPFAGNVNDKEHVRYEVAGYMRRLSYYLDYNYAVVVDIAGRVLSRVWEPHKSDQLDLF